MTIWFTCKGLLSVLDPSAGYIYAPEGKHVFVYIPVGSFQGPAEEQRGHPEIWGTVTLQYSQVPDYGDFICGHKNLKFGQ